MFKTLHSQWFPDMVVRCRHWKTNQVVSADTHINVPNPQHHTTRFHRAHLHAALLEHVPSHTIHLGKKTIRADASDNGGVSLYFEDGSSAHGDILIGADGIHSVGQHTPFTWRLSANWPAACQTVLYP